MLKLRPQIFLYVLLLGGGLCAVGCQKESKRETAPEPAPAAPAVTIRLAVVDDPPLAAAISRLRGEWSARSGGMLEVSEIAVEQLFESDADILVYPSRYLGELAERQQIVDIRTSLVEREGFEMSDVFTLVRREEMRWGDKTMALSLGSPVYVLYYRTDLLELLQREPPKTWTEYQELVELLSDRQRLGEAAPAAEQPWSGCLEPLAKGWGGRTLLARAGTYVRHRSHYSTLFHIETMEPLIAGPGFVRALKELVAAARVGEALPTDPAGVRQALHAGQAALGLTWASAADDLTTDVGEEPVAIGFAPLPAAREVYDLGGQNWEPRARNEPGTVTVLAMAGRLASVTRSCRNVAPAQRLLAWLAGPEMSSQIMSSSSATTLVRQQQTTRSGQWVESAIDSTAAQQYADQVAEALEQELWLAVPRIPGSDRYLAALDQAVEKALSGSVPPESALEEAAARWREITTELGVDAQRTAYHRSLGL